MMKYNHNIATLSMQMNIPYNTRNYNTQVLKLLKNLILIILRK